MDNAAAYFIQSPICSQSCFGTEQWPVHGLVDFATGAGKVPNTDFVDFALKPIQVSAIGLERKAKYVRPSHDEVASGVSRTEQNAVTIQFKAAAIVSSCHMVPDTVRE